MYGPFHAGVMAFLASAALVLWAAVPCRGEAIAIHDGQKLAFLGDSITQAGFETPTGYCRLVVHGLETAGVKVVPIPAGVGGNKSNDMLNRLDRDVIDKKPDWVTVSCGVNDVWHSNGIPLDQYQQNMTMLIDHLQAAGIKVMILTATMIDEDPTNGYNQRLAGYNAFLRDLAKQKRCLLADVNADMQAQVKEEVDAGRKAGHILTMDGVHMNPRGNVMMATGILKAFGLNDAQLAKARDLWLDIPDGWTARVTYQVSAEQGLTLRQFLQLQQQTPKDNPAGLWDYLQAAFQKDVESLDETARLKQAAREKFGRDVEQRLKQ